MSRFFSERHRELIAYTPGEQPGEKKYIKLNTNESPFPPSLKARERMKEVLGGLNLYSDPECRVLREKLAEKQGVNSDMVIAGNGSDEVLNIIFMAFCDEKNPAVFPDITYGFYPVFANVNGVPYKEIPLDEKLRIRIEDYKPAGGTAFIANPNAHTGIMLARKEIEEILRANRDNIVVIDEAYADFSGESCIPLVHDYDNLIVVRTFSKSCSLAGARLGFAIACEELVADMNTIRYSLNPYNVNTVTMAAGIGTLEDYEYIKNACETIVKTRKRITDRLKELGFSMTDSEANFVFAACDRMDGGELYEKLKDRGILVRHFPKERICKYNRITIGSDEDMDVLIETMEEILKEEKNENC
ncbi:MAG: histidinol-phosphate transaminase [Lentihominibacter sp.]|jgi:histidinol-phosphate aminotransferase